MATGRMIVRADYAEFLASKAIKAEPRGLKSVPALAPHLFGFQRHCVDFALRAGTVLGYSWTPA